MTNENRHTPAPWYNIEGLIATGDEPCANTGLNPQRIASVYDEGEQEANAQLIAAAPELLEALENTIRLAERMREKLESDPHENHEIPNIFFNKAYQAISKARGES